MIGCYSKQRVYATVSLYVHVFVSASVCVLVLWRCLLTLHELWSQRPFSPHRASELLPAPLPRGPSPIPQATLKRQTESERARCGNENRV